MKKEEGKTIVMCASCGFQRGGRVSISWLVVGGAGCVKSGISSVTLSNTTLEPQPLWAYCGISTETIKAGLRKGGETSVPVVAFRGATRPPGLGGRQPEYIPPSPSPTFAISAFSERHFLDTPLRGFPGHPIFKP